MSSVKLDVIIWTWRDAIAAEARAGNRDRKSFTMDMFIIFEAK